MLREKGAAPEEATPPQTTKEFGPGQGTASLSVSVDSDITPDQDFCDPEWGYALALAMCLRSLAGAVMPV